MEDRILVRTVVWKSEDGRYYYGMKIGEEVVEVRGATPKEIAELKSTVPGDHIGKIYGSMKSENYGE